jgi:hypothetical protein
MIYFCYVLLHGGRTLESDGELGRIQKETIMACLRYICHQILRKNIETPSMKSWPKNQELNPDDSEF